MRRPLVTGIFIAIVALGLALRLIAAQGGLWMDEAWSAVLVQPVRTPLDILFAINHDNNHHLNSLWMWVWGFGASPLALRSLSIATGTLTIWVAALLGARRGICHMLIGAALFAVSPMLVNYGAEARGYAPMLLAAMLAIWLTARWLETPERRSRAWLALIALAGMLSQLTMIFVIGAITGWVALDLARRMPVDAAIRTALAWAWPMLATTAGVLLLVVGAAAASRTGMQVGGYVPFALGPQLVALRVMVCATLGVPTAPLWPSILAVMAILALMAMALRRRDRMAPFLTLSIIGLPVALAVLQIGNTGMPRYYLIGTVAVLLLVTDGLASSLKSRRAPLALAMLALIIGASLYQDIAQAALRRGDPDAAIAAMANRAPAGASIMIDHPRSIATIQVAAARARYPVTIVSACPAASFVHLDLDDTGLASPTLIRCGRIYRLILVRHRATLSGVDWALYEKRDLSVR